MTRGSLLFGGVITLGALGCGGTEEKKAAITGAADAGSIPPDTATPAIPKVSDFPYEQHLPAGYRLDVAAVQEPAYHGYYNGGCCHGAYSALVKHLADTVGAPFDQLPIDFGKFGGGGIAGYGSICGAVLGGVLVVNMVVAKTAARTAMLTDLMRWYEGTAFPMYVPAANDSTEANVTLDFSAANIAHLQVVPRSHLCHSSVSSWCAARGVAANGGDKLARCSRLTADVAGKVATMINAYLASGTYAAGALDATSSSCMGCHPASSHAKPVAAGMRCDVCHSDKVSHHP